MNVPQFVAGQTIPFFGHRWVCLKIEDTNSYVVLGKRENHPLKLGVPDFQTIPDVLFPMLINRGVPLFKQRKGK